MIKKIFIYWGQKFINAPIVVKQCLLSWKLENPTWDIIELDDTNLQKYIDIKNEIPNMEKKNITKASYSDIIRIFLLEKYGGCWCEATLFCNKSLDKWLINHISSGFFGFCNPSHDRLIASWFLYCEKNNYIIKEWKKITINYWINHNEKDHYYWFHHLLI